MKMQGKKNKAKLKVLAIAFSVVIILGSISVYLKAFQENVWREERDSAIKAIAGLAQQGAAILEVQLDLSMSVLRNLSELLKDVEDIQSEEVFEYLNNVLKDKNLDMLRLGIALPDGTAVTTAGNTLNISERDYFQEGMKGNELITGALKSKIIDEEVIFLSVPIYDRDENIKGVVYGVIERDSFHVYDKTEMSGQESNMYIIDGEGNYVMHYEEIASVLKQTNFFDEINHMQKSIAMEEIEEKLEARKPVSFRISDKESREYLYVNPIDINKWSVVTVINDDVIQERVHYLSDAVSVLMIRMGVTVIIFAMLFYYMIWMEKKKIEQMNKELLIRDNIFQVAVSELDSQVFLYDAKKDEIKFMSSNYERLGFPQKIEKVSENMLNFFGIYNREMMEHVLTELYADLKNGYEESKKRIILKRDGQSFYYGVKIIHFYEKGGLPLQSIGMIYDISENYEKELMLKHEEKMRSFFMSDSLGVYEINVTQDCVIRSDSEEISQNYTYSENLEMFVRKRVAKEHREQIIENCSIDKMKRLYILGNRNTVEEFKYVRDDGTSFWAACEIYLERDNQSGNLIAFITTKDIDAKKQRELYLKEQAVFDSLTKVYNRNAGKHYISEALKVMQPNERSAFMILDLDYFKQLNDTLGHVSGDAALIDVARIMKDHFREYDIICRLGGDEFIVFIQKIPVDALDKILTSLLKKLELSYERDSVTRSVTVSVGVAIAPLDGCTFEELYKKADQALYEVKKTTRNAYRIYGMPSAAFKRREESENK